MSEMHRHDTTTNPTVGSPLDELAGGPGDEKVIVTDGPFAETKEQIGGYYIIEAADLD